MVLERVLGRVGAGQVGHGHAAQGLALLGQVHLGAAHLGAAHHGQHRGLAHAVHVQRLAHLAGDLLERLGEGDLVIGAGGLEEEPGTGDRAGGRGAHADAHLLEARGDGVARVAAALAQGALQGIPAPTALEGREHRVPHLEGHARLGAEVRLQPLHTQVRSEPNHGLGNARENVLEVGGQHAGRGSELRPCYRAAQDGPGPAAPPWTEGTLGAGQEEGQAGGGAFDTERLQSAVCVLDDTPPCLPSRPRN